MTMHHHDPDTKKCKEKNENNNVDDRREGIGQGELYSPAHAIKIDPNNNQNMGKGVGMDIKNKMVMVKDKLLEKLAAASVPSDALDNAKHLIESVIRDVTSAAQGLTKEALHKIKSHLADVLPSLSPSLTSKMVDDAEKEAGGGDVKNEDKSMEGINEEQRNRGKLYASPAAASSLFFSKPISKL